MMVYLSAPYSSVEDKNALMNTIMTFSGRTMVANPGTHIVSPLFNHFSLKLVPEMGSDYVFWKNYSRDLLKRCDCVYVLMLDGWNKSTGVKDEIMYAEELNIPVYMHWS